MQEVLKKFDEEIEEYINLYEMDNEDYIKLEESLADLIIRNYKKPTEKDFYDSAKKLRSLTLDKSIKLAIEFLQTYYNSSYVEKFEYALNNIFVFDVNEDLNCSFYRSDINKIYLNLLGNIYDPITIIHEFMHYVNNNEEVLSDASDYFTEAISYYNELLFEDFITNRYKSHEKELKLQRYGKESNMYIEAIQFKILSYLLKVKLRGNKLNRYFLWEAIENISYIDESDIEEALNNIQNTLEYGIYHEFTGLFEHTLEYVVADVFCKYLYSIYKKNKNVSIDINEAIKNYSVEDLFNFLEVDTYRDIDEEIYNYKSSEDDDFSIPIVIKEKEQKKLEYIYKKQKRA